MDATPPFRHSILLKGEVVKVASVDDGVQISLRHGTENYKIFVETDVMSEKDVRTLEGLKARLQAKKLPGNRWVATSRLELLT